MFRFPPRLPKTLLSLLLASSLTGCMAGGDGPENENTTQLIRGSIPLSQYSAEVVGVRVLAANEQVSSAKTDANGNFSIEVPVGTNYSFEIVTASGTHPVLVGPLTRSTPMQFDVCNPGEDFDVGDIDPLDFEEIDGDDTPWSDTEDECEVPPWICEDGTEDCYDNPLECDDPAADPSFCWDEPIPCDDPASNPEFCWGEGGGGGWGEGCTDPMDPDGNCGEPPPWCDPSDPNGGCDEPPPWCDPSDPNGGCDEPPPWCDPSDPNGGCDEPPPWCDPSDPNGGCDEPPPWCDPSDPNGGCDEPPPPCDDPSDPESCWEEPLPCDWQEADPNNCFDIPLPCDDPNADPQTCYVDEPCDDHPTDPDCGCDDEPPFPCDNPDGDPNNCFDEPLPCEHPEADPEFCLGGCEMGDPSCFGDDDPPDAGCEDGYDEPSCWPEPDICIVSPEGDFTECDENIGGAPQIPFPDFGCEDTP